eukprot:gnl/MRDRNA2_/MRDRNA2_59010_c0_seq1.p1 gnl/MRDRNA2_/MRDRNA2_59010_c0~~gnl/MRDRNA2_/MRDRNA2_59010_c0_seq1.p1  ORF type:complete len:111 (-),score=4.69 gnl/MRDRNA2_/MRDRNA2_59010_c0_seq1:295-627(-)
MIHYQFADSASCWLVFKRCDLPSRTSDQQHKFAEETVWHRMKDVIYSDLHLINHVGLRNKLKRVAPAANPQETAGLICVVLIKPKTCSKDGVVQVQHNLTCMTEESCKAT